MRVVIADDEPMSRDLLRALFADFTDVAIVAEASDGAEAVAQTREHRPDLLFLDIDMPHSNGLRAAAELAEHPVEIVFVTAHEEHAIEAFEIGAIDYVLKPVNRPRLARTMDRARARYLARSEPAAQPFAAEPGRAGGETTEALWVPLLRGTVRVAIQDIVRIEAAGDHVYLHTAERAYLYRATMADLERRLAGSGLLRVHRSAFIRPDRVVQTSRRGKVLALTFGDGTEVAVGRNYRTAVLEQIGRC